MKKFFLLYTIVFVANFVVVFGAIRIVEKNGLQNGELRASLVLAGIKQLEPTAEEFAMLQTRGGEDIVIQQVQTYNYFTLMERNSNYEAKIVPAIDENYSIYIDTDKSGIVVDEDMIYNNAFKELPLHPNDYYYGKYLNARQGAKQLNLMPIFKPGDSVGIIRDQYINIRIGYMQPPHYYYGSGVCWTSSTLGATLDVANEKFKAKYGLELFIHRPWDRAPHGGYYLTYTNNHRGYTIFQISPGVPGSDYRFTINPQLANIPELSDIKVKIVLLYSENHPNASHGESIAGYVISNKEF